MQQAKRKAAIRQVITGVILMALGLAGIVLILSNWSSK